MKRNAWLLEALIYISIVAVGMLAYSAIMKYGIPWYYCRYYSVCIY